MKDFLKGVSFSNDKDKIYYFQDMIDANSYKVLVNSEQLFQEIEEAFQVESEEIHIKLLSNILRNETLIIPKGKKVTIDFNGFNIAAADNFSSSSGLVAVSHGATLKLKGYECGIRGGKNVIAGVIMTADDDISQTATLIVEDKVIIEGWSFGVTGEGSSTSTNTRIELNGGIIRCLDLENGAGVYHPQGDGILIVDGAEVLGSTGIEVRAGSLEMKSGTVKGIVFPNLCVASGGGSTTSGCGIAVCQHITKLPINVKITGGFIEGYCAFFEANPQKNSQEDISKIKLSLDGGYYFSAMAMENVYSEDVQHFITSKCHFGSTTPDDKYMVN